jgi:hypothetical protein
MPCFPPSGLTESIFISSYHFLAELNIIWATLLLFIELDAVMEKVIQDK